MASRNDRRRPLPQQDVKQAETWTNVVTKLGVLALAAYCIYLESTNGVGSVNALVWPFLFGAFFGKEAGDKLLGGKK